MSKTTLPQSIFGDQTNIKRCVQPPGGNSTIMFGGESVKSDAVKGKNHQASDIFNLDENKEATKKHGQCQQDTQNRLFGVENTKTGKADGALKSFNPITGALPQSVVAKEEEENEKKKDAEPVSNTTTSCTTTNAAAGVTTKGRQPPGGKSTKLW